MELIHGNKFFEKEFRKELFFLCKNYGFMYNESRIEQKNVTERGA